MNERFRSSKLKMVLMTVPVLAALALILLVTGTSGVAIAADPSPIDSTTKTVNPDRVPAGAAATYAVVLRNTSSVSDVMATVDDALDSRLTYVPGSAATDPELQGICPTREPHHLVCEVNVAANETVTLSFQVEVTTTVSPGDVITNTAVISDGYGMAFDRAVSFTVGEPPTVQIREPDKGTLITTSEGEPYTISGYAWDSTNEPGFPADPVLDPINNSDGNGTYYVEWASVPGALDYTLKESTSPYFDENVIHYTNAESPKGIFGKSTGTYYYRLMAHNVDGDSRWSNVVSATVTNPSLMGFPEEALLGAQTTAALPTVEVRIDGGTWQMATVSDHPDGHWQWSYDWTLPEADEVPITIEARAQDAGGNYGEIDAITVTVRNATTFVYLPVLEKHWPPLPYAPTLFDVNNSDNDGNYTVIWSYGSYPDIPAPTSFELQEATNASFTADLQEFTVSGSITSRDFTDKENDTYYYRVRAINSYGAGPWSETKSVLVDIGFFDDFSDSWSGWPVTTYSNALVNFMRLEYVGGTYRMKVLLDENGYNNRQQGQAQAPIDDVYDDYDVFVDHYFAKASDQVIPPDDGTAGLVFAGDSDFKRLYVLHWNYGGYCGVFRYDQQAGSWLFADWQRTIIWDWRDCRSYGFGSDVYNHTVTVLAEVRDNKATLYTVDGDTKTKLTEFYADPLRSYDDVGLITGAWDTTPVESRFDNFGYTPAP